MKALWLTMLAGEMGIEKRKMATIKKYRSYWHNISCKYTRGMYAHALKFKIWSFYDQICGQENSPYVANDNDDTRWTIHDYISSLAFMANEPIMNVNEWKHKRYCEVAHNLPDTNLSQISSRCSNRFVCLSKIKRVLLAACFTGKAR